MPDSGRSRAGVPWAARAVMGVLSERKSGNSVMSWDLVWVRKRSTTRGSCCWNDLAFGPYLRNNPSLTADQSNAGRWYLSFELLCEPSPLGGPPIQETRAH